jgi:MFS family permease
MSIFLIISTLSAMLGAYPLGLLADRLSPKKVLSAIVLGWVIVLVIFSLNRGAAMFWILGPVVGLLLGGVWATSRPLLMRLTPPEKLGEFFGLFSLSGRSAAICGPLVWGGVVYLFSPDKPLGQITAKYLALSIRQIEPSYVLSPEGAAQLPYRLAILSLAALVAVGFLILRKVPDTKGFGELR